MGQGRKVTLFLGHSIGTEAWGPGKPRGGSPTAHAGKRSVREDRRPWDLLGRRLLWNMDPIQENTVLRGAGTQGLTQVDTLGTHGARGCSVPP